MVTSNKQADKKVVKMAEQNNSAVVPQRTLLGEVNEHITCPLCRGYYIDATTIVECLHSFCRSCIIKHLQVKSYCPVCEMMINSAKPNIKLDKALQDIVYKLVPGLFQKEMERRQQFYASRPGPAASATPEQRGEDTERIIFSPEDVISFSLEYADATDTDSISSKSSDSNEPQHLQTTTRRYLQCPAVVNINHLKKFLSMKFDIDSTQFAIDILYKRVPLPDYYTLMDIAYIYNWKRNEPMRFFYQIIDYVAIRNRLFDINRKEICFTDRKSSPTCTEDTNVGSPLPNANDHISESSSGTDSPMPEENHVKKTVLNKKNEILIPKVKDTHKSNSNDVRSSSPLKKNDDEVEKSQFLNSFELQAKNNLPTKLTPSKSNYGENNDNSSTLPQSSAKSEETLKRKFELSKALPEMKKIKLEIEKTKLPLNQTISNTAGVSKILNSNALKAPDVNTANKTIEDTPKQNVHSSGSTCTNMILSNKEVKQQQNISSNKLLHSDSPGQKRPVPVSQTISPKRKPPEPSVASPSQPPPTVQKTVSPLKLQIPKPQEKSTVTQKPFDVPKSVTKKIPDLKPSLPASQLSHNKGPPIGKLRMDLLANNCDPTIDRSKILSQVKSSLPTPNAGQSSGDPLKSLFDSCKINIPSSLSITLTDQKLDPRISTDASSTDPKNNIMNKNLTTASNTNALKGPSPPVHNYIEILKLPENDTKKQNKSDNTTEKTNPNKPENNTLPSKPTKTSETSAKGPIPNLKPIAESKLGKQSGNFSPPTTFQQTFEQQLLSMQTEKKPKVPKSKTQVPKLVPATPKAFSAANKLNNSSNKCPSMSTAENKTTTALDLSTPHNIQSQLGPQQTKAFETMQSIANLAKKQSMTSKALPVAMSQANVFSNVPTRPLTTGSQLLRVPNANSINQLKLEKANQSGLQQTSSSRQDSSQRNNQVKVASNTTAPLHSPSYTSNAPSNTQPSPRSQTRSPSSSPKLIIAEEKQTTVPLEQNTVNQSNQITSTQLSNMNTKKTEAKPSPGPSKPAFKPLKQMIRQPNTPMSANPQMSASEFLPQQQLISHAMLRHQMELQQAWLAQRNYDIFKNMAHQGQNFNNKDKQ